MNFSIGDRVTRTRRIGDQEVSLFAELVGDYNSIHFSDDAARAAGFQGRIAHGMIASSMLSEILGTELPGPGSVYLSQTLSFRAPILIPSEVTLDVEITAVREEKNIYTLSTTCTLADGTVCIAGEALILKRKI